MAKPEIVQAPQADVVKAMAVAPVYQNPAPAPRQEIDDFRNAINQSHNNGNNGSTSSNQATTTRHDNDEHEWDHRVRQWDPRWVQYDQYYRPVICNPFRETLRVVYVYNNAPRVVYIQPLASISVEVRNNGAYNFTAVRVNAFGVTVDVTAGNFFGGGYYPGPNLPPPPPPPPVITYTSVQVTVRYTKVTYRPIPVRQVIDCGYDPRVGSYKVLLDGVTPVWGSWNGDARSGGAFVANKTQQFPGLGDPPGEQPMPYNLVLAGDESSWTDNLGWYIAGGLAVMLLLVFRKKVLGLFKRPKPEHI